MAEKSQNADSGKEIKEKTKKINKKEKTTQQQKGLPTLSADLNYQNFLDALKLVFLKDKFDLDTCLVN